MLHYYDFNKFEVFLQVGFRENVLQPRATNDIVSVVHMATILKLPDITSFFFLTLNVIYICIPKIIEVYKNIAFAYAYLMIRGVCHQNTVTRHLR
jgi:hypothetical protein